MTEKTVTTYNGFDSSLHTAQSRYAVLKQLGQLSTTVAGRRCSAPVAGRGAVGCVLFLVYRDPDTDEILHAWAGIAGQNGIKPQSWYILGADGKPVEVVE